MRIPHILKGNVRTSFPKAIIFFDTETKEKRLNEEFILHTLILGCACFLYRDYKKNKYQEMWKYFYTPKEFWDFVEEKFSYSTHLFIVSHNLQFDLPVVQFQVELPKRGYQLISPLISTQAAILTFKKGKNKLSFIDNTNFYKLSIKELGKTFGLEKKEIDFNSFTKSELKEYVERDVEILKKSFLFLIDFIKSNDLGNFSPTIASQAFTAFRHRFMPCDIYIHNDPKALTLERESYHGGRCECFFIGEYRKGRVYHLDVNSMYPFVMKSNLFPVKLIDMSDNFSLKELKDILKKYLVIAKVKIDTNKPYFPYRYQGKLCFPIGKFTTTLATPELKIALRENAVKKALKVAIYKGYPIFTKYVNFFYSEKLQAKEKGNKGLELLHKIFLNSLYGKFGQKGKKLEKLGYDEKAIFGREVVIKSETGEKEFYRYLAGLVYLEKEEGESFNSFPAIASHVTSYARSYLLHLLTRAGFSHVLYTDTDSLFVNEKGYEKLKSLIDENRLGYLSVKEVSDKVTIFGAKDYLFGDKEKLKGIPKDAEKIGENKYEIFQWMKLRSLMIEGETRGYLRRRLIKELARNYDKGIVLPTGKVEPLKIFED